jgi:hypothetical protein
MNRCAVFGLLLLIGCEKKAAEGLPPATDWKPSATQPAPNAQPGPMGGVAPANPHATPDNPHATPTNPHATPDNPHATPTNPHATPDNPHAMPANPGSVAPPAPGAVTPVDPHGDSSAHHGAGGGPLTGSAGVPSGAIPDQTAPTTLDKRADGRLVLGPFTLLAPKEWVAKPVTSSMRAASFILSAKPNEEAELVVFYFGEGGAGPIEANLDRWVDQFAQADGKPSKGVAKIEKAKFAGQEATLVSVSGKYNAMAMPGAPASGEKPNQALLGAIVASPSGPYYFKLVGAKKTVDAHAKRFRAMLTSLQLAK